VGIVEERTLPRVERREGERDKGGGRGVHEKREWGGVWEWRAGRRGERKGGGEECGEGHERSKG